MEQVKQAALKKADPEIFEALEKEKERQHRADRIGKLCLRSGHGSDGFGADE